MDLSYSAARFWLVDHPIISQFEWRPGYTVGSSLVFLSTTVLTYLSLTFFLRYFSLLPHPSPAALRFASAVHNLLLLLLSFVMAIGCSLSAFHEMSDHRWIFCFPHGTPPRGSTFFWANVFYLSKILEFVDTLLIILSGGGNSNRRLSFLHVYHHAVVVVMCYIWLRTSQSLFPLALVTNASVHVLMYGYYLLCAIGRRPSWKRAVTDCQIVQFLFSFLVSILMLYYHFSGPGCSGMLGWCFNAAFNASLLALFMDFHRKNYEMKKRRKIVNGDDKRS